MRLNRREIILVIVYLVIISVAFVSQFLSRFGIKQHQQVSEQIDSLEQALVRVEAILESKPVVGREYDMLQKKFSMPGNQDIDSTQILQDIKKKANDAGLNVINIKPFPLKTEGLYKRFDFQLETEGELQNLGEFLYKLDDSPYLFDIKYTQVNAQSRGQPLKMQLMLSAALARE